MIQRLVAANPKTIVVLDGTMVEMDQWLDQVPAVLQAWYSGMEGGNALARVLFGDVKPSGKLPCTFPKLLADSPSHALGAYPGTNGTVAYAEGLLVGYRWFDAKNIKPLIPFGFGFSYTVFKYSSLKLVEGGDPNGPVVTAQFRIKNTGARGGGNRRTLRPPKQSKHAPAGKGIERLPKNFPKTGGSANRFHPARAQRVCTLRPDKKRWVAEPGKFEILIGASSRDLRLRENFNLTQAMVF